MIRLALDDWERELLRRLPRELASLLETEEGAANPALRRLFPPAYAAEDDDELEVEYRRLMGEDLRDRHRAALETLMATVDAEELDPAQAEAWLIALNEMRLVLGTGLGIEDDEQEPPADVDQDTAAQWQIYDYLATLQDSLIRQLA